MKKNGVFLVTLLMALLFWQWSYFSFSNHFGGLNEAKQEIKILQAKVGQETIRSALLEYKFDLFKQQVAMILPKAPISKDPIAEGQKRGLASLLQAPKEDFLLLAQVESAIEEMTGLFEERRYKEVVKKGRHILSLNPMSTSIVLVYFMLAESYYQLNELDLCMEMAQVLTQQFPEHEKTGWVLLRVGLFLKEKNRVEEAQNMFALVAYAFPEEPELTAQAKKLRDNLGGVE